MQRCDLYGTPENVFLNIVYQVIHTSGTTELCEIGVHAYNPAVPNCIQMIWKERAELLK